jgi:hypothetical protein
MPDQMPVELAGPLLLLGVLLGIFLLSRRPSHARLWSLLVGGGLGGLGGVFLVVGFSEELMTVAYRAAGLLAKMGFPRNLGFPWCIFSAFSGVIVSGMAVGGGLGWWMKRERVK